MFKCILCNSTELLYVMNSRDNSEKKIYNCKKCNMRQLYPRITNNEEILKNGKLEKQDLLRITSEIDKNNSVKSKHLENLHINYLLENDGIRYLKHFDNIINSNNLPKKLNVLDVGSGYGYFPFLINKKYNNIDITATDLNHNKLLYGKNTLKLDIKCIFEKIEDETFIKNNENKFDIITSWHVLEHVYDPVLWMKNILRLLKKNGICLLEIPNEDDELIELVPEYSKIIHFQDHVNYFYVKNIKQLLKICNIKENDYKISGVQRYGFYNYIDWLRFGTKSKVISDDYRNINNKPRHEIEKRWIEYRESNLNSDTIYIVIKNN